jgi:hypothetical protein
VFVWLEEIWPGLLPPETRAFTRAVFGSVLVLVFGAVIEEGLSRRRLSGLSQGPKGERVERQRRILLRLVDRLARIQQTSYIIALAII